MTDNWILGGDDGHTPVPVDDLSDWARRFRITDRHVAQTDVGPSHVSTVFLGIDHNFGDDGPPVLFETLVFDGPLAGEMTRYCTWADAAAGHTEMVARVTAAA